MTHPVCMYVHTYSKRMQFFYYLSLINLLRIGFYIIFVSFGGRHTQLWTKNVPLIVEEKKIYIFAITLSGNWSFNQRTTRWNIIEDRFVIIIWVWNKFSFGNICGRRLERWRSRGSSQRQLFIFCNDTTRHMIEKRI